MVCKKCNREVADTTKFCPYCGTKQVEVPSNYDNMQNGGPLVYGNEQASGENVSQPTYENEQKPMGNGGQPVYEYGQEPMEHVGQPMYDYGQTTEQHVGQPMYNYGQTSEQHAEQSVPYWERKPEKKSKRKLVIPCAILALVLVVGCVAFAMKDALLNIYHGQFDSDIEYYRHVEQTNRDKVVEAFCDRYDEYLKQYKAGSEKKYSLKVELGDKLKSTISAMGIDVSKIDSVTLTESIAKKENIYDFVYDIQINDSDFVKAKLYADVEDGKMYVQIPELSKTYLDVSYIFDSYTEEEKAFLESWGTYSSWLPTADALKKSMTTYSDILFEGMEEASKSSATLTATGVSQECTKVSVSCDEAGLKDMAEKVLVAAKEDETINEFLEHLDEMSNTASASEYMESVEEALEELQTIEASAIDGTIDMDVYVDGDGDIIGRVINVESKEDKVTFCFCKAVENGKMGVEYKATVNGLDVLCFEGSGTIKDDAVTGDFTFTATEENKDSVTVNISAVDYKKRKDGTVSGTLSIRTETLPGASLDLTFAEEKSVKISVSYGGFQWGTVTLAEDSDQDIESAKPESDAKFCDLMDENEVQDYYNEVLDNAYVLLARLSELTGIEEDTWYGILGLGKSSKEDDSVLGLDYEQDSEDEEEYEDSQVIYDFDNYNNSKDASLSQEEGSGYEYSTSGEVW